MEKLREAAELGLIAVDPRQSMEVLLELVKGHTGAASGALFIARAEAVETVARRGVSQASIDRVSLLWHSERARLRDGRPCLDHKGSQWCLWPLGRVEGMAGGFGLLYLEVVGASLPVAAVRGAIEGLNSFLLGALRLDSAAARDIIDEYLEATPAREVSRRQLLRLLDKNEWNLSRVARLAGVTRVTIYKRLKRLGIQRIRVQKVTA